MAEEITITGVYLEKVVKEAVDGFSKLLRECENPYEVAMAIATMEAMINLSGINIPQDSKNTLKSYLLQEMKNVS